MDTLQTLDEFRDLARTLPEGAFSQGAIAHPRLSLFAATHEGGDSAEVARAVESCMGDGELVAYIASIDADLRLYELDPGTPASRLDEADAARTIAYGMTAIEPGPDFFCLGTVIDAADLPVGILEALHAGADPLHQVAASGRDTAALFGAIVAARMAGLPVVIEGGQAMAAALMLNALAPGGARHCAIPSTSLHRGLAEAIGMAMVPVTATDPLLALADAIRAPQNI